MNAHLTRVRRVTVVDAVVEQIKAHIVDGTWRPGDRLPPEHELAERFGAGRPAVREALKALSLLGLIRRTQHGTFVSEEDDALMAEPLSYLIRLRRTNFAQLFEARRLIEVEVAGLAAERARPDDVAAIEVEVERMMASDVTPEAYTAANVAFHLAVAAAAHNPVLLQMLKALRRLLREAQEIGVQLPHLRRSSAEAHRAVLDAIVRRDPAGARAAMLDHLADVERELEHVAKRVRGRRRIAGATRRSTPEGEVST